MQDRSVVFREVSDGVLVAPPQCGLLTVPDLISHVRRWCAGGTPSALTIDLTAVEQMDAAALRSLIWARRYCASFGHGMVIVPPPAGVLARQEDLLLQTLFAVVPAATPA